MTVRLSRAKLRTIFPSFALVSAATVAFSLHGLQTSAFPVTVTNDREAVQVIAHRGGAALCPENTLAAYRKAIRNGVDYVEVDVRQTADGQLVIMHDRSVDRTTDGRGDVAAMNLRAIRRLNAAAKSPRYPKKERVPTLEEVAWLCKGKAGIYLDHKSASVDRVLAALDRVSFGDRLVVYGGLDVLREYRSRRPGLLLMPGHPPTHADMSRLAINLGPVAFDGHLLEWTEADVQWAHSLGAGVWLDVMGPTDNEEGYAKAVALRVDGLQTDYPDRLLTWLRARGLR